MRGTVTAKKLKEANEWLAKINANEKELRFVMGKKNSSVCINCYLRCDKIYKDFKKMLKNNEKEILKRGWDIGDSRMSFSSKEILVTANPSDGVSCIELKFRFSILGDALNEISTKINFVIETLDFFKENIKDLKITIDIKYSVEKMLNTSKSVINDLLMALEYEEKKTYKGEYRKFEIMNKHNITNKVILKDDKKYIDADISINVENIVIENKDISQEIQFSLYYYIIEYFKLHYNLVNAIDSEYIEKQHNFYNKVKLKI